MVRRLFVSGDRGRVSIDLFRVVGTPLGGIIRPRLDIISVTIEGSHIGDLLAWNLATIEQKEQGETAQTK